MIDTVKLVKNFEGGLSSDEIDAVLSRLQFKKSVTYNNSRTPIYNCNLENIGVTVTRNKISLYGSVPKYLNGHNYHTASFGEVGDFIECVSDIIKYDFRTARLDRLDVGVSIETAAPPSIYINNMLGISGFESQFVNSTKYFEDKGKKICVAIYDKLAEMKVRDPDFVPPIKNALRFEVRLLSNNIIRKVFGIEDMAKAELLKSQELWNKMIDYFMFTYDRIEKTHVCLNASPALSRPLEVKEYLAAHAVNGLGGVEACKEMLKVILDHGGATRTSKSRSFQMLEEVVNKYKILEASDLIDELNASMSNCKSNLLKSFRGA